MKLDRDLKGGRKYLPNSIPKKPNQAKTPQQLSILGRGMRRETTNRRNYLIKNQGMRKLFGEEK